MKKLSLIVVLLSYFLVSAQGTNSFQAGERISYNVFFNLGFIWINAAEANFEVKNRVYEGNPAYKFKMTSRTIRSLPGLNFRDTTIAYVNRQTLMPIYARATSHEPNFFSRTSYNFSNEGSDWQVMVERERPRETTQEYFSAEQAYFDLLSTIYRLRNVNVNLLSPNEQIPMPMVFSDGFHDLYVLYLGREQIRLRNGRTFNAIRVQPAVAEGNHFERGARMTMWISDDENRIPLKIESRLRIGSLRAMLDNVENTVHPMTSEVVTTRNRR